MDAWIPRPGATGGGRASGPSGRGAGQDQTPVVPIYKIMQPVEVTSTVLE
jgi:hypothetical protein